MSLETHTRTPSISYRSASASASLYIICFSAARVCASAACRPPLRYTSAFACTQKRMNAATGGRGRGAVSPPTQQAPCHTAISRQRRTPNSETCEPKDGIFCATFLWWETAVSTAPSERRLRLLKATLLEEVTSYLTASSTVAMLAERGSRGGLKEFITR